MKTHGGFYVSRVHQLSGRAFEHILKKSGVDMFNGPQGRILYVLWDRGELSISEVGKLTSLAKTTLTSMLDRMEEAGLVCRTPDINDRRQIFITITEKAKQYKTTYDAVSEQMNTLFYKDFREDEIVLFENMLERIMSNLESNNTIK